MRRLFFIAGLLAAGCDRPKPDDSGKALPARQQCFAVVDGQETRDHPAVVLLFTKDAMRCTGTFVSDTTLLTAGHCVFKTETGDTTVMLDDCAGNQTIGVESTKLFHQGQAGTDFGTTVGAEQSAYDLVVVLFPPGTAPAVLPLSPRAPAKGDELTIVGFGSDKLINESTSGLGEKLPFIKKREGKTAYRTDTPPGDLIEVQAPLGDGSATSRGDSGGPVLLDGRIAGVASFGAQTEPDASGAIYNIMGWVNLRSEKSRALFERAKAEGAVFEGYDAYAAP